jgi:hypothetical protein
MSQTQVSNLTIALKKEETKMRNITTYIQNIEVQTYKLGTLEPEKKILNGYITYLTYIKNIIDIKIKKDRNIGKLLTDVFGEVNNLSTKIKSYTEQLNERKAKIEEINNKNQNAKKKLQNTITKKKLQSNNAANKYELLQTGISDEEFKIDNFKVSINSLNNSKNTITNALTKFKVNVQKLNSQTGGVVNADKLIVQNILISNVINSKKLNNHGDNLKKIKEAYERGLTQNFISFQELCGELLILLKSIKISISFDLPPVPNNTSTNNINKATKLNNQLVNPGKTNKVGLNVDKILLPNNNGTYEAFKENKDAINALIKTTITEKKEISEKIKEINNLRQHQTTTQQQNPVGQQQTTTPQQTTTQQNPVGQQQTTTQQNPAGQQTQNPTLVQTNNLNIPDSNASPSSPSVNTTQQNTNNITAREKLAELINELEKETDTDKKQTLINEVDKKFKEANYTINSTTIQDLKNLPNIPTNPVKYNNTTATIENTIIHLIDSYIRVQSNKQDKDDGLARLTEPEKNRINKILNAKNKDDRYNLLLDLFENRPNRSTQDGGKHPEKKKSKSKNLPEKKKSKSKNLPKKKKSKSTIKNHSGGFVRGGVLFPQDFYDTSNVM